MKGITPTQRTLRELRQQGFLCDIVERYLQIRGAKHGLRKDLFGIIDIIALVPRKGVLGVQSCGSEHAKHVKTIEETRLQETVEWLRTPGTSLELWSWRKVKVKRGGKAMVWRPRITNVILISKDDGGWSLALTDVEI